MKSKDPITTHVLDTRLGKPASNISCVLQRNGSKQWTEVGRGRTNSDGRVELFEGGPSTLTPAIYRIIFDTGGYFRSQGLTGFYPEVVITFEVTSLEERYHVPLLLSPYGYSTYRGS